MSTLQYRQVQVPPGVIDLGLGQPDDGVFPAAVLRDAMANAMAEGADVEYLQYGADYGDGHHRVALAGFLTDSYGCAVDPEHLFTTNGNSQALQMVCSVFTSPGDVVLVEETTYHFARLILTDHGLRVVGVPVGPSGLDVDVLEATMAALARAGTPARLLYTIPTFQNPTGVTVPAEGRARLVRLAEEHGTLLVADEVYHLLGHGAPPPPPFSAWVPHPNVLSLGTFSKIFSPGLRLGWLHAAPDLLARLAATGVVLSGGGLNPMVSAAMTAVLRGGALAPHIDDLRSDYRERAATLCAALREHLPAAEWTEPDGGYFVWLRLPGEDGAAVRSRCQAHGVDVREGALFGDALHARDHLRLCFAYYRGEELHEGVARLARALGS